MANIAVDFDRTYTSDPPFWLRFMQNARKEGHNPFIVTARDRQLDWCVQLGFLADKYDFSVFCTNGVAKKWYMENIARYAVDIWIDDKPEAIVTNSTSTPAELDEWRATREY